MPIGITVPDDRFAYIANMGDDTISVIDIRRRPVVRTIPAGDDPDGIVFLPFDLRSRHPLAAMGATRTVS